MQEIANYTVTVALCVRDGERYIGEAIDSAKRQSIRPYEILVVDDGSQDESATIAENLGCVVIRQEPIGLGEARNSAFRNAKAPWLFFLDSDDVMHEDALLNLLTAAKSEQSAFGAIGFRRNFISPELQDTLKLANEKFLQPERSFLPSGSIWKTDPLLAIEFEKASITTDVEWILKLRSKSRRIAETQETVLFRRIHLSNGTSTLESKKAYLDLAIRNLGIRETFGG